MPFDNFSFGSIQIDGSTYEYDVVIDRGEISKRKKKASKQFREEFGHTPLSVEENIPWKCRQLVIGSGAYGRLPLMQEVRREAERLKIKLLVLPTAEAVKVLEHNLKDTNAILHVTCQCSCTTSSERDLTIDTTLGVSGIRNVLKLLAFGAG